MLRETSDVDRVDVSVPVSTEEATVDGPADAFQDDPGCVVFLSDFFGRPRLRLGLCASGTSLLAAVAVRSVGVEFMYTKVVLAASSSVGCFRIPEAVVASG